MGNPPVRTRSPGADRATAQAKKGGPCAAARSAVSKGGTALRREAPHAKVSDRANSRSVASKGNRALGETTT